VVDQWHQTVWQNILEEYDTRNIYNADETSLFYKLLPNRTLAFKGQKCTGGKLSKERLTLLLCANFDGSDKYPLLVIGKSAKPRCFKNRLTLPTEYTHNKKAWMTSGLFCDWIKKFDQRMAGRKVTLLLDNCPAHPKEIKGLKNVKVFYFPPNTTSLLQPMDQGVIRNIKSYYRASLNKKHVEALDKGTEFNINVLDALIEAQSAWSKVKQETIANCWLHMSFREYEKPISNEVVEHKGLTNEEFEEFIDIDNDVLTTEQITDEDIINEIQPPVVESESEEEECPQVVEMKKTNTRRRQSSIKFT
jgi:hypothetical protein